jgi:hypothetical protein
MADTFDSLLVSEATVLRKTDTTPDDYGVQDQTLNTLATGVPCRVSSKAVGRAKEMKAGSKYSLRYLIVYMRPYAGAGAPLNQHDWLQVTDLQGVVHTYDVLEIKDPSFVGHHQEILVEEITP